MTLAPLIQRLLAQLPPSEQLEFQSLLEAVYSIRFTGPITIDFLNGIPKQISLGQPVKLAICAGSRAGGLDNPSPSGPSSPTT